MPLFTGENLPPAGQKVRWEIQIPGTVTWTVEVDAITQEEAIALATKRVEEDTNLEPDDSPEPDYTDADVVGWETIEDEKSAA